MLNRQKLVLYMLECAGRPVGHLELVKWAFLLAGETPSGGGSSFYDFVPYRYGPFSFTLFREMENLTRNGYVKTVEFDGHAAWERIHEVLHPTDGLPQGVYDDVVRVVSRFQDLSSSDLIDYVYEQFPWFTINSKIKKLTQRPKAPLAVYTIGYEGLSIDRLLDTLMREGVQRLVDVRRNPVARRYGFHKSTLTRLCNKVDIEYTHVPEVGIPSELRQDLNSPEAYEQLFARYQGELLPQAQPAVQQIAKMIMEKPTALMCMEADPAICHRTRLGQQVEEITGLPLNHIQERKCEPTMN